MKRMRSFKALFGTSRSETEVRRKKSDAASSVTDEGVPDLDVEVMAEPELETPKSEPETPPPPKMLYEYYTEDGIQSGLEADKNGFQLNGKDIVIFSGSLHYFRVHPAYWRDRMRKMRACGLNAIQTYVPWNLHEPKKDVFDFGMGDNDMSAFLNVANFIQMAKEEDLFVIFRPGPYICAEWDLGGLPSWLLAEHPMFVRTSFSGFTDRVKIFFDNLLKEVKSLQFMSKDGTGGPIIAIQVENEYGSFSYGDEPLDIDYLKFVKKVIEENGMEGLYFTSDSPLQDEDRGAIPGVLMTANFQEKSTEEITELKKLQPDMPVMVTEFWTGWYDHWFDPYHHTLSTKRFCEILENIFRWNSSVNFYMFHGGTNFGFMNGANVIDFFPYYVPDVTSYDYDATLTEAGDYTEKYLKAQELISKYNPVVTRLPEKPDQSEKTAYPTVPVEQYMDFSAIQGNVPSEEKTTSVEPVSMETVGQSYGYIIYKKQMMLKEGSVLKLRGHVRDLAQVMVNGKQVTSPLENVDDLKGFGYWVSRDTELQLPVSDETEDSTVEIMVENLGRNNFGKPYTFMQKKGIWEGPVLLDGVQQESWEIVSLTFKSEWLKSLTDGWQEFSDKVCAPCLLKGTLILEDGPKDTFLDMRDWNKGVVFVNGFNLGRYFHAGPQRTLYLPAPLLKEGENEIMVFEQYKPAREFRFSDKPDLGPILMSSSGESGISPLCIPRLATIFSS